MRIKIAQKCRPFSHEVGQSCLLPNSSWRVTPFPTRIELKNLISEGNKEAIVIECGIKGPLKAFTVMQDLERGWLRIFGRGPDGFFSYRLVAAAHEIILFLERAPKEGIAFTYEGESRLLKRKEELIIPSTTPSFPVNSTEKLSFGCHKAQDWALMKRRRLLEEILPIWYELGKNIPEHPRLGVGTGALLSEFEKKLKMRSRSEVGPCLLDLFQVGFEGMLSPRLHDTGYHGISSGDGKIPKEASPLMLLGEGARLIRELFIQKSDGKLTLLPCLPKELHAGRFVGAWCKDLTLDFEWTKKLIRRVTLHSKVEQTLELGLQSSIKSFRIRTKASDKGTVCEANVPLPLEANTTYLLDRFQK